MEPQLQPVQRIGCDRYAAGRIQQRQHLSGVFPGGARLRLGDDLAGESPAT
jgi:hypothetical protein